MTSSSSPSVLGWRHRGSALLLPALLLAACARNDIPEITYDDAVPPLSRWYLPQASSLHGRCIYRRLDPEPGRGRLGNRRGQGDQRQCSGPGRATP